MKLKQALKNSLTKKQLKLVPSSFDIIGDIAIFNDFPPQLKKKEKIIVQTLMSENSHIKTVTKKVGMFSGKLRTQKLMIIAGEKKKETTHKENNCILKLNIEKCYFSPRLSTERLRIAKLVKKGEDILVLFSGVAPYQCTIAKNSNPKEIYGIELNTSAHKYALENIKLNKINNTRLYKGDVKKVLPKIKKKFNRIIMPLPKNASSYLDMVLKKLKPEGTIHLYTFSREEEFNNLKKEYKKRFKTVKLNVCGHYSPSTFRVCLDLKK